MEGGSNSPPPFLAKTYEMVDDFATELIVSWSSSGNSFVVWNPNVFSRDVLPKYFKHNNFSSFVRQLNTYGFRKVDTEQWEFANEDFARGQRYLLKNIHRRKPVHSHSLQSQGNTLLTLSEAEREELHGNIERLKCEKSTLLLELNRHIEQQNGVERQMVSLEEKMQGLLDRQGDIMESLSHIVQIPGFLSKLVQPPEVHSKKRRLLMNEGIEEDADKNMMHDLHMSNRRRLEAESNQTFDLVPFETMESALNTLENLFHSVSVASGGDMYYNCNIPSLSYTTWTTDILTRENGVSSSSPSTKLHASSPFVGNIRSSPELADSTSYIDNSDVSSSEFSKKYMVNNPNIDVNSEPAAQEGHLSRDPAKGTGTSDLTGVNDVFWQQFLSETPGSDPKEVQSERKEEDARTSEGVKVGWGNYYFSRKNVDHLTERIGHLTASESA